VVVSIAPVHLEHLGSLENIARAKGEIWSGLKKGGVAVLPAEEKLLAPHAAKVERRFTFGPSASKPTVGYENVTPTSAGCR